MFIVFYQVRWNWWICWNKKTLLIVHQTCIFFVRRKIQTDRWLMWRTNIPNKTEGTTVQSRSVRVQSAVLRLHQGHQDHQDHQCNHKKLLIRSIMYARNFRRLFRPAVASAGAAGVATAFAVFSPPLPSQQKGLNTSGIGSSLNAATTTKCLEKTSNESKNDKDDHFYEYCPKSQMHQPKVRQSTIGSASLLINYITNFITFIVRGHILVGIMIGIPGKRKQWRKMESRGTLFSSGTCTTLLSDLVCEITL